MVLKQIWRTQLGTVHTDETLGVATDKEGNVIIVGYTTGELVYGAAQGGYDAWLVKLSPAGKENWRKQFGTMLTDQGLAVAVDSVTNIAVAGYTTGEMVQGAAQGGYDAWIARFAPDGTEQWMRQVGTAAEDTAYGVTCDKDNNVIVAGYTAGDLVENGNVGGFDAWLAKFAPNGTELWRRQLGSEADDDAHDVAADSEGNIVVVGYTGGAMVDGAHQGGYDGWVARFATDGTEQWRKQLGSVKGDRLYSISFNSHNEIIVTGHTAGEVVSGEAKGGYDAWVAKFAADGTELWRHQVGTSSNDDARSVAVNSRDDIFIVGYTFSQKTANANAWVVKFKSEGSEVWREQLKSLDDEAACAIAIDTDDNIVIGGYTTRADSPYTSAWVAKFAEA